MDKTIEQLIEFLKAISPFISIPLLIGYGVAILYIVKKVNKLKDERIELSKDLNQLKDEQIKYLQNQISALQQRNIDPRGVLAEAEVIRLAADEKVASAKRQLDESLQKLGTKESQIGEITKAYQNLLTETEKARNKIEALEIERRQLSFQSQLAEKQRFLNTLSHELLAPLSAIHFHAEYILRFIQTPNNAKVKNKLTEILHEIRLMKHIIELVRSTSLGDLDLKDIDIYDEVIIPDLEMFRRSSESKKFKLVLDENEWKRLPHIYLDAVLVKQAFLNLLVNARDYTSEDGIINVIAREDTTSILVDIENQPGFKIDEAERELIFQPYYRTKAAMQNNPSGIGLGLYVARNILQKHGGDVILVKSGESNVFRAILPKKHKGHS